MFEPNAISSIDTKSRSVRKAQSWMTRVCGPHELRVLNSKRVDFKHSGNVLTSTSTTISHIQYGVDVSIGIEDLSDSYSISLPLTGFQEISRDGATIQSNIASGVIVSPQDACTLNISGNCKKTLVRIGRAEVETTLSEMLSKPIGQPIVFDAKMDAAFAQVSTWWRTVHFIQNELASTNSLYNHSGFVPDIEKALIKGLLTAQEHNYSDDLRSAFQRQIPAYLQSTVDLIRANAKSDLTIDCIIEMAGVSRNRLYNDFKCYFGEPPTAFLKRVRLEGVRRDIMVMYGQESISSLALNWGFKHIGRFSVAYNNYFGERPSDTLKRSKSLSSI